MPRPNDIHTGRQCRSVVAPAAVVSLGVLAAVGDCSGSAVAQSRGYIGAFAHSESTGAYGYGVHFRNSNDAAQRAIRECRARPGAANDCVMVKAFGGLCAALAVAEFPGTSTDGKPRTFRLHYVGTSQARGDAQAAGLTECRNNILDSEMKNYCKVLKVVCSDDRS